MGSRGSESSGMSSQIAVLTLAEPVAPIAFRSFRRHTLKEMGDE